MMTNLYIVKCNEFYKIGVTKNIQDRLVALQTGNPYEISLVGKYRVPNSVEGLLHDVLKKAGIHVRGEWFAMENLIDTITEVCENYQENCVRRGL